jgi:integrase
VEHNKPPKRVLKPRPIIKSDTQAEKAQPDGMKAQWHRVHYKGEIVAGLYLVVDPPGKRHPKGLKRWMHRYRRPDGSPNEIGIGHWPEVKLFQAHQAWLENRFQLRYNNVDPLAKRQQSRGQRVTFRECAERYILRYSPHRSQSWLRNTKLLLLVHGARLAPQAVGTITQFDVDEALGPLAAKSPKTARRALEKWARVFDFARSQGLRLFENPARWKDLQEHNFPGLSDLKDEHYAALPYEKIPEFMRELRQRQERATGATALEFCILTTSRSDEVLGAQWSEFDFEDRVWTVPAERTKQRRQHLVPLSDRALALLTLQRQYSNGSPYVFTGYNRTKMADKSMVSVLRNMKLDVTVHGFRSSFRDWCGNETHFAPEPVEHCLAHKEGDTTEQAYRRETAFKKRIVIMQAWADYCG